MEESLKKIEEIISLYFYNENELNKKVITASNDAIRNGGKRLRPLIMLETYRAVAGSEADDSLIAPFLAAIEMIHTFSLIHDDLPAMDNDRLRRGKPTTWVSFGEDMAILAGDMLAVQAFETVTAAMQDISDIESIRRMSRALNVLAAAAGAFGMIGGQCVDVEYSGKEINLEILQYIYALKTGALLQASFVIGGIIAGANEVEIRALKKAGALVGEAFQIRDDCLDITSDENTLGKPIHSDEKNKKTTYVSFAGIEESEKRVEELSLDAIKALGLVRGDMSFVISIINMMINRKY